MNWFNRYVLGPIAPGMALKREMRGRALKAYYEAAEPSRYRKPRYDKRSANAQTERQAEKLRTQARHLDDNYDVASGILDVFVANVIGRGIQPEPQVMLTSGEPATEVNTKLLKLYDPWSFAPEVTGTMHVNQGQRLLCRAWARDGEGFVQRIIGNVPGLQHGTVLPYSLEFLESDFVPHDYNDAARRIIQGIEVNAWGRPIGYHVYKGHPGDSANFALAKKRIAAANMMHIKLVKRFHQLRGITMFATVMNRLDDIKEVDENERIAARVAAAMAAVIKKGLPDMYDPETETDSSGNPARREMSFEPGIIFDDLLPGETVETIDTKRPNNALIPFRDAQIRSAAAGTMVSFSSASKNYNGTYSAQRQELVEQWAIYQMLGSEFTYRVCQPIWDGFVDAAILSGAVEVPAGVDRETLYDCTHTGPSMVWIDPLKEADALVMQLKWGFKARSRIIRERGDNPDQVNREILRDQKELERLGIELIGDGSKPSAPQEEEQTEKPDPNDEPSETDGE